MPFCPPACTNAIITAATGIMLVVLSGSAAADLTICNQTREPAGVAVATKLGTDWRSNGWWTIEPGRCKALFKGRLTGRDYYLHALHYKVGGRWEGDKSFCIDRGSFSIKGRMDCKERGYESAGFLKINTHGKSDWQHTLADSHETPSQGSVIDSSDHPENKPSPSEKE